MENGQYRNGNFDMSLKKKTVFLLCARQEIQYKLDGVT